VVNLDALRASSNLKWPVSRGVDFSAGSGTASAEDA